MATQVSIESLFTGAGRAAPVLSEVELSFGGINLRAGTMTVGNWLLDETGRRTSSINAGIKVPGRRRYVQCTNHRESGKGFTTDTVRHPEGSIILIEARAANGRGIVDRSAGVFIRLRTRARNLLIQARLPSGTESMIGPRIPVFIGRGDILSWDELRTLDLGIKKTYHVNNMGDEDVADCFDITTLDGEIEPRPSLVKTVVNGRPEVRAVQAERPRRFIRRS